MSSIHSNRTPNHSIPKIKNRFVLSNLISNQILSPSRNHTTRNPEPRLEGPAQLVHELNQSYLAALIAIVSTRQENPSRHN